VLKPIINLDEVTLDDVEQNGIFTSSSGPISDHIGPRSLAITSRSCRPASFHAPSIVITVKRRCS